MTADDGRVDAKRNAELAGAFVRQSGKGAAG